MVHAQCCNPFNLENHKNLKTKSRAVSTALAEKAKQYVRIQEGVLIKICDIFNQRICGKCSIKLYKLNNVVIIKIPAAESLPPIISACTPSSSSTSASNQSDPISIPPTEVLEEVYHDEFSEFCIRLGGSPVRKYRFVESGYCQKQLEKVVKLTCENVLRVPVPKILPIHEADDEYDQELLHNILEAFNRQETSYANQVFLLSLLPEHWPVSKIMDKFKATQYMVQMSKNLIKEYGHGSFPESRKTKPGVSSERITIIEEFYRSMDISRHLPGTNDFVSVRDPNGGRIKKQKMLVLCSLAEAYQHFLEQNPTETIGFSKFAELRPKECILAGQAGTHNICVCIIHQNNNLLCPVISKILKCDPAIINEKELLKKVSCANLTWDCCEAKCAECNELVHNFIEQLKDAAKYGEFDEVTYNNWIPGQNIYKLEKITSSIDEITEKLSGSSKFGLAALRKHDYITKEQSSYLKSVKTNLQEGEYVVILDFSENYKFVTQNEVQAAHYFTRQATLFPIVAYYKSATGSTSIISYAVISEEETHDTVAVYGFQTKFLTFLKSNGAEYPTPKKICYFSDGAVSQFKNKKNFANINFHKTDFDVDCEWNFFAPSHGKGPSDGVGGTIKRSARAASLRNVDGSLFNTPEEFFQWCKFKSTIKSVHFDYVSKSEYAETKKLLNKRFCNINTVKNTRQIYQVTPNSDVNFINTKTFSNSLIINKTPL